MSRNEWIIIRLLALAVVVVFVVLLGLFIDAYPILRDPSRLSALFSPAQPGRGAPFDTVQPTPAGSSADYGYRLCYQDVAAGAMELVEDLGLATSNGTDNQLGSCQEMAGLQVQTRIVELTMAHQNCPVPSDPHLQAVRHYLDSGLAENTEAGDCLERYCAGGSDADWLGEANSHIGKASELGALADQEMQAYYASY